MATDKDVQKDFEEAYNRDIDFWGDFIKEAKEDTKFDLGDQWAAKDAQYLKGQGREARVWRKTHRVKKLITGYQRKNRLALTIEPTEGGDEQTASQFTGAIMWGMGSYKCNGYNIMSDAFENGTLVSGINLVEVYLDYQDDLINGDFRLRRWPYNRFLLDAAFSERNFTDLRQLKTRDYLSRDDCKRILPEKYHKMIDEIKSKGRDGKFTEYSPNVGISEKNILKYDQFWVKSSEKYKILVDPRTGQMSEWEGTERRLKEYMEMISMMTGQTPDIKLIEGYRDAVRLNVLVEGEVVVKDEPNPLGIKGYSFVPVMGFWCPEYDKSKEKLQGIIRLMRDPATENNKRHSQMIDLIEGTLNSGYIARENAVINKQHLYQSGQAQVIWLDQNTYKELPIDQIVKQLRPPEIPAGMFQQQEAMDRNIMEIPGANSELMGMPENDNIQIAGILSKMRQASGLTILQDIFDNYIVAKKGLGNILVETIQKNWSAQKIQRIINKKPTKEFYDKNFGKYDCSPSEGVMTDTQKQMNFNQLLALKAMGVNVPDAAIVAASNLTDKESLQKAMAAEAQEKQQMQKIAAELQKLNAQHLQSKIVENRANAAEQVSQVQENRVNSELDRVRAIKELQEMDYNALRQNIGSFLEILKVLNQTGKNDSEGAQGGNVIPMGPNMRQGGMQ